jgi:hypothetical protein
MLLMSIEAKVVNQHLDLKDAMKLFEAVPDLRTALFRHNERDKPHPSSPVTSSSSSSPPPSPSSLNEKEKHILLQWMESERLTRYKDFHDQMNFIKALTDISEKMRHFEPRDGRKQALPQLLSTLVIPARAYIPLGRASDPFCRVIRVLPTEGTVFSTHSRAPCLICFEVIEESSPQLPILPPNSATTFTTKNQIPNAPHQNQRHDHIETDVHQTNHAQLLSRATSKSSFSSEPFPSQVCSSIGSNPVDSPRTRLKYGIAQQYKSMSSSSGALKDEEEAQIRKMIQQTFRQEFYTACNDDANASIMDDGKPFEEDTLSAMLNYSSTITNQPLPLHESPHHHDHHSNQGLSSSTTNLHVTKSSSSSVTHPINLKQQLNIMIDTTTSNLLSTDLATTTALSLHSTLMRRSSKTAYEMGLAKIMLLDTNVFGESWDEKKKRIQASSPDGHAKGWNLISLVLQSSK